MKAIGGAAMVIGIVGTIGGCAGCAGGYGPGAVIALFGIVIFAVGVGIAAFTGKDDGT